MSQQQDHTAKQQAFMALYEPVHAAFARFCKARVYNSSDAQDLISETVLQAYENFDKLRHQVAFLSYLFGVASNILKQKNRRKKFWGIFDFERASERHADNPDPEITTDMQLLYEALQKLPEEQSEAIILFEISGFQLKDVQQIQGCSLSAVKARVVRGKKKLAQLLNDQETLQLLKDSTSEDAQFLILMNRSQVGVYL